MNSSQHITLTNSKEQVMGHTAFVVGDKVVTKVPVQPLELGTVYTVKEVITNPTPFGTLVEYLVEKSPNETPVVVQNGHLILCLDPEFAQAKREDMLYERAILRERATVEKLEALLSYIEERVNDAKIAISIDAPRLTLAGVMEAVKQANELVGQYNAMKG